MTYGYFSEYGKVLPLPEVNPRRRYSSITADLQKNKDPKESNRTRTNMLLAYKIIGAIKNKGWNKSKFAEEMKKKPSVVTRWLSGTHNFTSDTLCDIGFVLGINLFDLENESKNSPIIASSTGNVSINIFEKGIVDIGESYKGLVAIPKAEESKEQEDSPVEAVRDILNYIYAGGDSPYWMLKEVQMRLEKLITQ